MANTKVSFFRTTAEKYAALNGNVNAGAVYFVTNGTSGKIYLDGKCYGEMNVDAKAVNSVSFVQDTEHPNHLKIEYTVGDPTYVALPEGAIYTAGNGLTLTDKEFSADMNYITDNVKLGQDITVTQATGAIGSGTKISGDKSVKDLLLQILQQVKQPGNPTLPSVSVSLSNAGAKEVGSKVIPSYTVSFNAGSYTYGPATGVTASTYSVSDGTATKTTSTGTFDEITVGDSTNYKVTAVATYGDGVVAHDNTGAASNPVVKIAAGTTSAATSSAITGFRSYFYGTKIAAAESYDSASVRALTNSGKAYSGMFRIAVPAGTKQVVIAAPARYSLKSVINVNLSRGEVADTFEKSAVQVEGANGYTAADYNVWVFNSATALDENTFEVTLG